MISSIRTVPLVRHTACATCRDTIESPSVEVPMARQPLTIIGDVYVEDFKPVRLKRDTTKKVGVNVYESELTDVDPRTASPGGAALLAHLLVHEIGGIQVVLPIHEQWDIFKLISGNAI